MKKFRSAYGAGFRAGKAPAKIMRPGGTRGIKHIITPLNPFDNVFSQRLRPLLALTWVCGYCDGLMKKVSA